MAALTQRTHRNTAVVSSTVKDLPEHRARIMEACLEARVMPMMMEHLPARGARAVESSMQLVDEAQIYIGVFAHRYGHVPEGQRVSVTEMEFDRACERKLELLPFLMHPDHPLTAGMVEINASANRKLERFKKRVQTAAGPVMFISKDDLYGKVCNGLAKACARLDQAFLRQSESDAVAVIRTLLEQRDAARAEVKALEKTTAKLRAAIAKSSGAPAAATASANKRRRVR